MFLLVDAQNASINAHIDIDAYNAPTYWTIFPRNFCTIQVYAEFILFFASLMANGALIALAAATKNEDIRSYEKVVMLNCVIDVLATIANFAFGMQIELSDSHMVIIATNRTPFGGAKLMQVFGIWTQFSAIASAIHVIAITFYFRYMLVCKSRILSIMQLLINYTFLIVYAMIECGFLSYAFYTITAPTEEGRARDCKRLLRHPIWHDEDGRPPANCIYTNMSSPFFVGFLAAGTLIHSSVYIIIGLCARKILIELQLKNASFSKRTNQLHRQMNFMLFSQMATPIFTAFTPVFSLIVFPIFGLSLPGIGLLINILLAAVPLMNPLTAIGFVGPYKRCARRALHAVLCLPADVVGATVTDSQQ